MGKVDMIVYCLQDAKKMLLKQAKMSTGRSGQRSHESVLPARSEEDASEASQDGPLEEMSSVEMRVFCPQDAKKMLLKQAKMVYWKNGRA